MQCKKNQINWVVVKKVMHQTSNKGQSCQQHKLLESYMKNCFNYRPPIEDLNSQSKGRYV